VNFDTRFNRDESVMSACDKVDRITDYHRRRRRHNDAEGDRLQITRVI